MDRIVAGSDPVDLLYALAFHERIAEHSKYPLALYCSSDIHRNLIFDGKYFH